MLNEILTAVEKKQEIIIFGCGERGTVLYKAIKKIDAGCKIIFADNDAVKQSLGQIIDEKKIEIINPKYISHQYKNALIIITSLNYYKDMEKQLLNEGISGTQIVIHEECFKSELHNVYKKRFPKKELNFVIDIAEHCNLNCQNCDHFSPLSPPSFMDVETFEKDIRQIAKVLGSKITHIDLEGGEPLLHDRIIEFIKIIHKYCPESKIKIFTNGILLPKMKEEFWEVCKKYKVVLEVTKYPIQIDYNYIEQIAKEKEVELEYFSGGYEVKTSMHKPIDLEGRQNKYDNFMKCYMANSDCADYKNGRLYPCTFAANIHIFNQFFKTNICENEKNYIDMYTGVSEEEVFEFLSNPIPACKYCKIKNWTFGHAWCTSRKKMSEWT